MIIKRGITDFLQTMELRRLWTFWGWLDLRQKYRRSLLGPFWITATMAISISLISIIYGYLFKQELSSFLPYVAIGYIFWAFITGFLTESCQVFIINDRFINQVRLPLFIYPTRLLWKHLSTLFHHFFVLIVVLLCFSDLYLWSVGAALLGVVLTTVNIFWIGVVLGLLSVRARDIPALVGSLIQMFFFITPVIWPFKALGAQMQIAMWNPFFHFLEVIRKPLIEPDQLSLWGTHVAINASMAVVGWLGALFLFSIYQRRLNYWL